VPPPSPRATHSSGAVLEIEEQQYIAIGAFVDAEAEEEIEFASDSSYDDYRLPIPDLPPRQHDHEVGGSSRATDPALLAILEGMRVDQWRAAEEQARRDRDQDAINAAMQAKQDELQRQLLTIQEQQLSFQAQQTALMAALMAASGIQLQQIQLPGTSSMRPPTLVLYPSGLQSQSQPPLQLPAQSQPFSTPQHQVSQGAISSCFEQVP